MDEAIMKKGEVTLKMHLIKVYNSSPLFYQAQPCTTIEIIGIKLVPVLLFLYIYQR